MQKQVRDTSLLAYLTIIPELAEREQFAYNQVKQHPYKTAYELAKQAGQNDPNTIRPRLTKLAQDGLIYAPYKRVCTITKRLAYVWLTTA